MFESITLGIQEESGQWIAGRGGLNGQLSPRFLTRAEAQDWLIQLFIKINGLNATFADVPLDSSGIALLGIRNNERRLSL
jgi:hypothetical protein